MKNVWIATIAAGMFIVGCDKSDKSATPSSSGTTPTASTPTASTPAMSPATTAPAAAIPPAPADATAAASAATQSATTQAAGATAAADAQAQTLVDQAMTYIKENKLDLADKTLTQVEGMKANLSPTMQKGVDQARTMLNGAKAGGGLKLPSLGGGAK